MSPLDRLVQYFEKFPGVGARQAKRFAFHILTMTKTDAEELAKLIAETRGQSVQCASCQRYIVTSYQSQEICSICSDMKREHDKLMVVASDSDIIAIERSGVYNGLYFVLGGIVPLLHSDEAKRLRGGLLKATIEARLKAGLSEVILGFAVSPDGENTARYVEAITNQIETELKSGLKITELGRGLSTGSELEYADPDTIKNALRNRG